MKPFLLVAAATLALTPDNVYYVVVAVIAAGAINQSQNRRKGFA